VGKGRDSVLEDWDGYEQDEKGQNHD